MDGQLSCNWVHAKIASKIIVRISQQWEQDSREVYYMGSRYLSTFPIAGVGMVKGTWELKKATLNVGFWLL